MPPSSSRPSTHAYGRLKDQVGDLLLPAGASEPLPVVVLVHGGFWRERYRRDTLAPLAEAIAAEGYATWNIEYRRVGASGGGHPETADDVLAAFDALGGLPAPLDLGRVTVVGHSAGGHLALWLAAQRRFAGVVALAGVADLVAADEQHLGSDAVREFLRGGAAADHGEADPARLVPTGVPSLLVHGDEDANVPLDQSERYLAAATAAGDDCRLLRIDGADHFVVIDPSSDAWAQAWAAFPGRTGAGG